jgi:hypothetical protein
MLQEIDATIGPTVSIKLSDREVSKLSSDEYAADVINFFSAPEQASVRLNAQCVEAEQWASIAGLTVHREREPRLIDPIEDSLYMLISAAALGYLVIALLSL